MCNTIALVVKQKATHIVEYFSNKIIDIPWFFGVGYDFEQFIVREKLKSAEIGPLHGQLVFKVFLDLFQKVDILL